MYSLKNALTKNPVTLSGAVVALVNFGIVAGWLDWDGKTVAALNTALVALLGLFVANTVVSTQKLDELNGAVPAKRAPRKATAAKKRA